MAPDPAQAIERSRDQQSRRFGGPDRRVTVAVVAVAAFILVAVVKPWAASAPESRAPETRVAAVAATAAPAARAATPTGRSAIPAGRTAAVTAPIGVASDPCFSPSDWLVVTDDVTIPTPTRTWVVATPLNDASGPADPAIRPILVASSQVRAIGLCAPDTGGSGGLGWTGTLWSEGGSNGRSRAGSPTAEPSDGTWSAVAEYSVPAGRAGALAGAIGGVPESEHASPAGTEAAWPAGRYVLEARPAGGGRTVWFGVEVVTER